MQQPTALRAIRFLSGLSLAEEARAVSVTPTALSMCENGEPVSDRTRRLVSRRHPAYDWRRLQSRVDPGCLRLPKTQATA